MDHILQSIKEVSALSRSKKYLRASQIRDLLGGHRKNIDEFRSNLMVRRLVFPSHHVEVDADLFLACKSGVLAIEIVYNRG